MTASNEVSENVRFLASMTCAETCLPARAARRVSRLNIAGVTSMAVIAHVWRHELEVETSPRANDEHTIAVFQAKSFNRVTPGIRETNRADEHVVDGSPNGIAKTIPHHSSRTRKRPHR